MGAWQQTRIRRPTPKSSVTSRKSGPRPWSTTAWHSSSPPSAATWSAPWSRRASPRPTSVAN